MDYPATQIKVTAKLKKYGFTMTLSQTIAGAFDPVSGTMTEPTTQDWPVFGMKGNLGKLSRYSEFGTIPGTEIQKGDVLVLLQAGVVIPQAGDILTMQDVPWHVMASDGLDPGGLDLIYSIWARK